MRKKGKQDNEKWWSVGFYLNRVCGLSMCMDMYCIYQVLGTQQQTEGKDWITRKTAKTTGKPPCVV